MESVAFDRFTIELASKTDVNDPEVQKQIRSHIQAMSFADLVKYTC